MGTELLPVDSDLQITRFWGGNKRGTCYVVTLPGAGLARGERPDGMGYIELNKDQVRAVLEALLKEVLSETEPRIITPIVTVVDLKKRCLEVTKGKCDTCFGFGLWPDGTAPMGPMDAEDGMPTIACPKCLANRNPIKDKKRGGKK
jgi:hypothetical protein